jgi:hypothetical protein
MQRGEENVGLAFTGPSVCAAFVLAFVMPGPAFADGRPPLEPYAPPAHEGAEAHPSPSSTPNGAEEDPAFALRLQHRSLGRLSLELNLGIDNFKHQSNAGDPFPVTRILLGYRKNVTPVLGYHLRGGPMLGIPRRSTSGDPGPGGVQTDTTLLTGASAEGVFVLGPFGHFFVGPILCFDYVHFSNTVLDKVYPTVYLHNGFTAGGGFDIGGVFGAREQLIVYQSLRMTAGTGDSMIFLLFGIGWLW